MGVADLKDEIGNNTVLAPPSPPKLGETRGLNSL